MVKKSKSKEESMISEHVEKGKDRGEKGRGGAKKKD